MKNTLQYFITAMLAVLMLATSCSRDHSDTASDDEGGLLRVGVSFGPLTRLAEITDPAQMAELHNGLQYVGLYVYYTDDYNRGDLSTPYVRNLKCTVMDGQLKVVVEEGENPTNSDIYIYDRMTLVAFYPYNEVMNQSANYFSTKADEEKYLINRQNYDQTYIPYRAQTETDPTRAFYTRMNFTPKHTYKVEIVVVAQDESLFPSGDIKILPATDPVGNTIPNDGSRQVWIDKPVEVFTNDGSGSDVRRYTAYLWTVDGNRNDLKLGDVLLESGNVTVIALRDLTVSEQYVYRYGCNLTTGEIFIPTSETLVYDRTSLAAINNGNGDSYQVCDIDMSIGGDWTPIKIMGGRFDGGGHAIRNMTVNSTDDSAGLFSRVQGNATVCNVDLVNPVVNLSSPADTCYAGALVGRINAPFSEADKQALIGDLPPGISKVVRDALIAELMAGIGNSTTNIVACRVENPAIAVTGKTPYAGTVAGLAGGKDSSGNFRSRIWDTYNIGGTISVNPGAPGNNAGGYAGGFIGLNDGYVTRSYTTIGSGDPATDIDFKIPGEQPGDPAVDAYTGFATQGSSYAPGDGGSIVDSYAILPDSNLSVKQMPTTWPSPSWVAYTGIWPVITTGWLNNTAASFWYSAGAAPDNYPTLQWERK